MSSYLTPLQPSQTKFCLSNYNYQDSYINFYTGNKTYMSINGLNLYCSAYESGILNSSAIGGNLSIGSKITIGSDVTSSGNLLINNIGCQNIVVTSNVSVGGTLAYKNHVSGYLYVNNMSLPFMKSITDTSIAFTNLNLNSLLGTNGNNSHISLAPNFMIRFFNGTTLLYTLDNSSGNDFLYNTVVFSFALNCLNVNIYFNNILI